MWKTNCVVAVQIGKLLEDNKGGAKEKEYQELYWGRLSGCGEHGAHAVGKEVRLLTKWLLRVMLTVVLLSRSRIC